MSGGSPPLVAPTGNGSHTSVWFALRYIHNQIPDASVHDLVKLVASIGAETKGKYTLGAQNHALYNYQHFGEFPSVGSKWISYVGQVVKAASTHHHKDWVQGFSYSGSGGGADIPGTGGPNEAEKISTGILSVGSKAGKGVGSLFSFFTDGKNLMVILIVVAVIVVLSKK